MFVELAGFAGNWLDVMALLSRLILTQQGLMNLHYDVLEQYIQNSRIRNPIQRFFCDRYFAQARM